MKNLSSDLHPSRRCGGGCGQCGQLPVHQSRFVLEKLAVVQAPVVRPAAKRPGLSTGAALSTARGFGGRWCSRWSRPAPKENSLNLENFCLREVDRFRQRTCSDWLMAKQARLGVEFIEPTIGASGYQQHRFGHGARHGSVQFSTVDLRGDLRVVDPVAFLGAIHAGLGAEKAFGCGLWMLRRPV